MREARIRGEKNTTEAPIEYFLVQDGADVLLNAAVGKDEQMLFRLHPHWVERIEWISMKLGLKMEPGTDTINITTRKD